MPKCLSYSLSARNFERSVSPDVGIGVWHAVVLPLGRPKSDGLAVQAQSALIGTNHTDRQHVSFLT
jgi:hypothetical protein